MDNILISAVIFLLAITKVDGGLLQDDGPFISRSTAFSFMTSPDEVTVGGACAGNRDLNGEVASCKTFGGQSRDSNSEEVIINNYKLKDDIHQRTAVVDIEISVLLNPAKWYIVGNDCSSICHLTDWTRMERDIPNSRILLSYDDYTLSTSYRYKKNASVSRRSRHGKCVTGILWNKITRTGCRSRPCVHGNCTDGGHASNFACQCDGGWSGDKCNQDIDECVNEEPCQNGGTCLNLEGTYNCTCPGDFTGNNCENYSCDPTDCNGADVVFAIDASISQGNSNYEAQKQYIRDFISTFEISSTQFQLALVSFSFRPTIHCYLNASASTLLAKIDQLIFNGGPSYTGSALKIIQETVLTTANGMRSSVPKYVIVLTDGLSSNIPDTVRQADLLKVIGVNLISVAFGSQIRHSELQDIASNSLHVFPISLPDTVYSVMKQHMSPCPECYRNTSDVIVLFDSSLDLTPDEFYPTIDALKLLVYWMPIETNHVHISYIKYAQDVHEIFDFTQYQTVDDVIPQLNMTQAMGPANLSKALDHVKSNGFDASKGARSNARKFVVAFTQGTFDDFDLVKSSADILKATNVTVVAVGTGVRANLTSLLEIASAPVFAFNIGDDVGIHYRVLKSMISSFQFDVCQYN